MSSIYHKFCNEIQNEALGAYSISIFIQEFNRNSQTKVNILHIFTIMPFLINTELKKLVMSKGYKNKITKITSLIRNMNDSDTLGTLHNYIDQYKEYALTSLIFAIRLGFIELNTDTMELSSNKELLILPDWTFQVAKKLGDLFSENSEESLENFLHYAGVYI